jgi:hypothetical protein
MPQKYSVDPDVYYLAAMFVSDLDNVTDEDKQELAQIIQDAIEAWIQAKEAQAPLPPPAP